MTSVAMIMNGCNKRINNLVVDPRVMNNWLITNGGYVSDDHFVWGSIVKLGFGHLGLIVDKDAIVSYFNSGKAVILNVNHGGHWVLMTGFSGDNFLVNDPSLAKKYYTSNEVVQASIYTRNTGCYALAQAPSDEVINLSSINNIHYRKSTRPSSQTKNLFLWSEEHSLTIS